MAIFRTRERKDGPEYPNVALSLIRYSLSHNGRPDQEAGPPVGPYLMKSMSR